MIDRHAVETMSRVAGRIAQVKKSLSLVADGGELDYGLVRELLNDCQATMAEYCDTAPIRLIAGQVDEIMLNHGEENFSPAR